MTDGIFLQNLNAEQLKKLFEGKTLRINITEGDAVFWEKGFEMTGNSPTLINRVRIEPQSGAAFIVKKAHCAVRY